EVRLEAGGFRGLGGDERAARARSLRLRGGEGGGQGHGGRAGHEEAASTHSALSIPHRHPSSSRRRRMMDATRVRAALGCRGVCRTPCALSTSRAPPVHDRPCYPPAHRAPEPGRSLMRRLASLLAVVAVLLLPAGAPPTPAQQKTLVVTGYGGRWSEVMKKALIDPFEKQHGVKVELVTGITTEWVAKLMAGGPDHPVFDLVMGNEPPLPIPRERGFFEPRNVALAPNIKNVYDKALIGDTSLAIF